MVQSMQSLYAFHIYSKLYATVKVLCYGKEEQSCCYSKNINRLTKSCFQSMLNKALPA